MLVRFRRAVIVVVPAALVAGTFFAFSAAAKAGPAQAHSPAQADHTVQVTRATAGQQTQQCQARTGAQPSCQFAQEIKLPLAVSIGADASPQQGQASVSWEISCSLNGDAARSTSGAVTAAIPFRVTLSLPRSRDGDCTLNASVKLDGSGTLTASLYYTLAVQVITSIPSGDTRPGAPLAIFKCLTDAHDSTRPGAKAVLGDCSLDYATAWTFDGKHIIHHGLCLTDPHNGGARTWLVLARCTGAADQAWRYISGSSLDTRIVLRAHNGRLCLDNTRYSRANGTPLSVYTCDGGPDETWFIQ